MERFTGYRGQEPLYVGVKHKTILGGSEVPRDKYDKPIDAEVELAAADLEFAHIIAEGSENKHKTRDLQREIEKLKSIVYEETGEGSYVLKLIRNNKKLDL
jgi:hypothetical protein